MAVCIDNFQREFQPLEPLIVVSHMSHTQRKYNLMAVEPH